MPAPVVARRPRFGQTPRLITLDDGRKGELIEVVAADSEREDFGDALRLFVRLTLAGRPQPERLARLLVIDGGRYSDGHAGRNEGILDDLLSVNDHPPLKSFLRRDLAPLVGCRAVADLLAVGRNTRALAAVLAPAPEGR